MRQLKRKVKYIFFSDQLLLPKTNKSTRRWFLESVRGCVSAFIGWSFSEITTLLFPGSYRFQTIFSRWGIFQRVVRIKLERKKKNWNIKKANPTGCGALNIQAHSLLGFFNVLCFSFVLMALKTQGLESSRNSGSLRDQFKC